MKKILSIVLLCAVFVGAQSSNTFPTQDGKILAMTIPITLAKAATNYSTEFSTIGYLPYDSVSFIPILWQCNDTAQITISIQVKNSLVPSGTAGSWYTAATLVPSGTAGSWYTAATLVTHQLNAGNDTLYTYNIIQRGTAASGVADQVSLGGHIGDKMRVVVAFANGTTVGNSGTFRLWMYLKKH